LREFHTGKDGVGAAKVTTQYPVTIGSAASSFRV
jgi:hypothetical protein